jgi:GNAT superfamily N-acetyltransferase
LIPPARVATAEDAKRRVLATATETRFGTFVHDPDHDQRIAATQLLDAELPSHTDARRAKQSPVQSDSGENPTVQAFLERLNSLFARLGFDHRVVSGVGQETFARLAPVLSNRGYERELYWALIPHRHESSPQQEALKIEAKQHGSKDARAVHEAVGRDPDAIGYAADVTRALDGTELVGYRRGRPVGVAGWYVHGDGGNAVARFTHVGVHPDASDEGVGAAMVSAVVEQCPLPRERQVVCATEATTGFYEHLGFTRNNHLWRFAKLP